VGEVASPDPGRGAECAVRGARARSIVKTDPPGGVLWQAVVGEGEYDSFVPNSIALVSRGYVFVGAVTPRGTRYSEMLWRRADCGPNQVTPCASCQ
jgi:hypothetical protein